MPALGSQPQTDITAQEQESNQAPDRELSHVPPEAASISRSQRLQEFPTLPPPPPPVVPPPPLTPPSVPTAAAPITSQPIAPHSLRSSEIENSGPTRQEQARSLSLNVAETVPPDQEEAKTNENASKILLPTGPRDPKEAMAIGLFSNNTEEENRDPEVTNSGINKEQSWNNYSEASNRRPSAYNEPKPIKHEPRTEYNLQHKNLSWRIQDAERSNGKKRMNHPHDDGEDDHSNDEDLFNSYKNPKKSENGFTGQQQRSPHDRDTINSYNGNATEDNTPSVDRALVHRIGERIESNFRGRGRGDYRGRGSGKLQRPC